MKQFFYSLLLVVCFSFPGFSQEKSDVKVTFSGFLETYYSYDFNQPQTEKEASFFIQLQPTQ